MTTLTLTGAQIDLLAEILDGATRDERIEARRCESADFKARLRTHLWTLADLRRRLGHVVTLDPDEAVVLRELLRCELGDLRVEIRHTDTWSYKAALRRRADDLRAVLALLTGREVLSGV